MLTASPLELGPPRLPLRMRIQRGLLLSTIFVLLVAWAIAWPYSADGDATLHYLTLRHVRADPAAALYPWARPLYTVLMALPAQAGILGARAAAAVVTILLLWQTMRMADDLHMPRPTWAGVLLILQPFAFLLASDTMTELPMALGIVIAIRLWWRSHYALSSLLVGLLPLVRPEGFLLAALWGVLLAPRIARQRDKLRAALPLALLPVGLLCWMAACWLLTGHALLFVKNWPWSLRGHEHYGRGYLLHHVVLWPYYCGPVLFILFIAGLRPSFRREMRLPWTIWLTVFGLHSLFWWRGWFASLGLMRIMATIAPITAMVCLFGWDRIRFSPLWARRPPRLRRIIATAALLAAVSTPVVYFYLDTANRRWTVIRQVSAFVRDRRLFDRAPMFFTSEKIVQADVPIPTDSPRMVRNAWGPANLKVLAELPAGAVGVWDNQRGWDWHQISIEDVRKLGYEPLFTAEQTVFGVIRRDRRVRLGFNHQHYVVLLRPPATSPAR